MNQFIYRSHMVLPSGTLRVAYTKNPDIAEKLGGVLTCRSCSIWHPLFENKIRFPRNTKAKPNL